MSAHLALQAAIYLALRSNAGVAALLADDVIEGSPVAPAIYDSVPQSITPEDESAFPYIALGDDTASEFDTDDVNGQEHTITLHLWSRYRGKSEVKQLADAVYSALHELSLNVVGKNSVYCFWEFTESIPEPDPILQHVAMRFRIVTQD